MSKDIKHPVIYVLVNESLNMSPGKTAAQVVHAIGSLNKFHGIYKFSDAAKRTVIVIGAKDQKQMDNLEEYLFQLDIPCGSYIDEGVNEVDAFSLTALAVGPIDRDDEETRDIFRSFDLYSSSWEYESKIADEVLSVEILGGAPHYVQKTLKWLREKENGRK